ncbi:MAG: type-F conjugative transfer system pilin assembly protein TrbC [Rhabdochlamydiaceae bacterium]|nr:type-F conjugative transfer system pilin assembly protein TrbC [Candidatus Amphrikana amoebophyrae]
MIRLLTLVVTIVSSFLVADEIDDILSQSERLIKQSSMEAEASLRKKCPRSESFFQIQGDRSTKGILFMSFSVPLASWKSLSKEMEMIGGKILIRGFPQGGLKELASKVEFLRKNNVNSPIQVDPDSFSKFRIKRVPSFVLEDDGKWDIVEGNIPIFESLRIIRKSGSTSHLAKKLLRNG